MNIKMNSNIIVPHWSSVDECQSVEYAFTSPVIMNVFRVSMWPRVFVMSVACSGSVVSRDVM